jgi:hypothetical protein
MIQMDAQCEARGDIGTFYMSDSDGCAMRSEMKRSTEAKNLVALRRHTTLHLFTIHSFVTYIDGAAEASRDEGGNDHKRDNALDRSGFFSHLVLIL